MAISGEAGRRGELLRPTSTGDVHESDLLVARSVEADNRLRRRLHDHATVFLVKIHARFGRQSDVSVLTSSDDQQLAPVFEDELRLLL